MMPRAPASVVAAVATLAAMAAVLPALVPAGASAQEAEDPPGDFYDVVDVEIVNIDVQVTDKRGKAVAGLGRDDFVVFQDGLPAEITNFYAVAGGRTTAGAEQEAAAAPGEPAGRSPALDLSAAAADTAEEHRLWMIVYIDNYNIEPLERNRVFPALRQFLGRSLRPGDQAMLVTYNRSLEVRQPFTGEFAVIADALDELIDDSGFANVRKREQMETLKRIDDADNPGQALAYARNYAEEQMNGVGYTTDALERLIESLGGLPGRKALLHVSSGIPMLAGEEMFTAVAEKFDVTGPYGEIPRHDTTRQFERINRQANAHRVAFYTVDAGGLRGMEFGNAEYGGFVTGSLRSMLDSVVPENLQAPLRFMALETGGKAIVNTNEILPALEEAAEDFRSFYSLGIASSGTDLGRYHEVEVKLSPPRKDLRLRHRAGYRSKTTDTRVRESLRSALLYSRQLKADGLEVRWGRPEPQGEKGHYLLPIQLRVPLAGVVLLPTGPGKHEARLKLYVAAVGEDGEKSEIEATPFGVRLADENLEAAKKESLLHTHQLVLSPGRKRVGVAVLDLFGRESSVVTRSIQVGPVENAG